LLALTKTKLQPDDVIDWIKLPIEADGEEEG